MKNSTRIILQRNARSLLSRASAGEEISGDYVDFLIAFFHSIDAVRAKSIYRHHLQANIEDCELNHMLHNLQCLIDLLDIAGNLPESEF